MSGCKMAAPPQAVVVGRSLVDREQAAPRRWVRSVAVTDNKAAVVVPGLLLRVLVVERVALQPEEGRLRTANSCQRLCFSFFTR